MCDNHDGEAGSDANVSQLLRNAPSNWGRWGEQDEVGALNFLTSSEVLRGVRTIRKGKVFTCGEVIGHPKGDPLWPGRVPVQREMAVDKDTYVRGDMQSLPGGAEFADDKIEMYLQGSTQFDALGHVWYDDKMWNGYPAASSNGGMKKASILPIAQRGVVGRGVLLDMAAYKGKPYLDKGDLLNLDDLLGCAKSQGVTIEKHDILCLRLGFLQLLHVQGPDVFYKDFVEPGLTYSPELVDWFYRMEIPCLSTDTISNETELDPDIGVQIPLHCALMRNLGVTFNEVCNFEELAKDCHEDGQWDFLYTAAPLKVHEATGAPVNVLAIK
ncbi:cyclase family protein [Sphingobium subterraneum]|uniref:Kynurenine formamidase n=1 Tax=Sphingobium subterraneum TaxID=627688 RepID=A0A841J3T5_9SPHN|nr:cyclase family protein [Sphingobium subterraneum]MBB6125360.1 kynurenine formamidase [Sphingobium subterraneum]